MNVLIILNSGQGVSLGVNFTLAANVGVVVPSTATLSELLAGKPVVVDNGATSVTVTSLGVCTNALILPISTTTSTTTIPPTTTTSTTTTSTTSTTSTTTTTTLPPADHYYFAEAYNCGGCSFAFNTYVKMAGAGVIGKFYAEPPLSFYSYKLLSVSAITTGQYLINIPYNTCALACTY
jgi:uncharacterized membrane protein